MRKLVIGVVGPCKSGKSVLKARLETHGYTLRHIAQEHSYAKDMCKRLSKPDVLIYLDVSHEVSTQRGQLNWLMKEYQQEVQRLIHAREHADLYIHTDELSEEEVFDKVKGIIDNLC